MINKRKKNKITSSGSSISDESMQKDALEEFKTNLTKNLNDLLSKSIKDKLLSNVKPVKKKSNDNVSKNGHMVDFPISETTDNDLLHQKPLDEKQMEILKAMNSEYLKNFVVFGYDMNGDRVVFSNCNKSEDRDAIFQMSQQIPVVLIQMFSGKTMDGDM